MRTLLSSLCLVMLVLAWACANTNDNPSVTVGPEASAPVDDGASEATAAPEAGSAADATRDPCTLADHITDPIGLCVQQQALAAEIGGAYTLGHGVAPSWSSVTNTPASGHRWQDDLGLAGALGAYYCSAEVYGNNHVAAAFNAVLVDLAVVLVRELAQSPPAGYDGETYFRMRWAQAAFAYTSNVAALALKQTADAYGAALLAQAYAVTPGNDGGSDAGAGGIIIGTKNADGSVAYSPAQTVMAAAALLDWAGQPLGVDGGTRLQAWTTAQQVLGYVLARGRDPMTGLFYQSLVTSSDPGHDALGPGSPTSDTFLTEDQAWITLGLVRAQDALAESAAAVDAGDAGGAGRLTYATAATDLATSVAQANLFDGTTSPGTPPPPGAFMEGLGPMGLLTNKTTIGNAILLGGLHRTFIDVGSALAYELGETRAALTQAEPAHTSLFSVVTDPNGNPFQQSYLRAASKAFDYAAAYGADGGASGEEPGATDYRSDAVHAVVEGLTQLWHGAANNPSCAP
jgi:hypothetical protein